MTVVKIDENTINDRISKINKIKDNYTSALNKTDFQFPSTSAKIKEIRLKNIIPGFLNANVNYLTQVRNKMINLDNKYSKLDPTNYEDSLKRYKSIEIDYINDYGKDRFKEIIKAIDNYGSELTEKNGKIKFPKTNWKWGAGVALFSWGLDTIDLLTKEGKDALDYTKYGFKTAKNILSAGKSYASWAGKKVLGGFAKAGGYVLDVALSGVDNFEEYGEFSSRMIAETVCESALNIGIGIGLHALGDAIGVGATVALTPFLGPLAPVAGMALGAIAGVAVEAVADYACEKLTGEKLVEYASDSIVNGLDKATGGKIGQDSKRAGLGADNSIDNEEGGK